MSDGASEGINLGLDPTIAVGTLPRKASRLEYIATAVNRTGFTSVEALAEMLGVSRMTVHRDLDELQRMGTLRKVRGGASAHRSTQYESDLNFRAASAVTEKKRIAAAAIELATDGEVVIIDDSTSALQLIPLLANRPPITVITNFLPAMTQLTGHPNVRMIALGGEYEPRYSAFLGMICENTLAGLFADVVFASTSSIRGTVLYHQDQRVVTTKQAMIHAAQTRVLLIDHTKIGQGALYRLCDVTEFTHVVVDSEVPDAQIKAIEDHGVDVIVA